MVGRQVLHEALQENGQEVEPPITLKEIVDAGYCVPGIRKWFASYELDFRDMVKNGISVEVVRALGDAMGQHVLKRRADRNG